MASAVSGWRAFLLVWFGQLVSTFGSGLTGFALGVWVYQRTGSVTQFVLAVFFSVAPRVALAPLAGVLADRWDRRWIMILSDAGVALGTLAIAALLFAQQLEVWHVYIVAALSAASGVFGGPAYSASVTLLVSKEQLGRANGLRQLARSASDLLAPAVAGFLMLIIGLGGVILIDVATFAIAILTLLVVRFPQTPKSAEVKHEVGKPSLLREALDGWRYVVQRPGLFGLMLMYAAASLFGVTTEVLLRPYVLSTATTDALGVAVSAIGLGFLVGGIIMSAWGGPKRRILGVFGFEALVSVCTIVLGFALPPIWIAIIVFAYFVNIALSDGSSQALWQSKVAPEFQGRVFSTRDMIASSAFPFGLLITAPLAEFAFEPALMPNGALANSVGQIIGVGSGRGIGLIFILTGMFNLLVLLVAWLHPRVRNVERELPDAFVNESQYSKTADTGL